MLGSSKKGRFQLARSMRWRLGGEVMRGLSWWAWMVSTTKAAIWGQTRGGRVEQRMTPTDGDDMAIVAG